MEACEALRRAIVALSLRYKEEGYPEDLQAMQMLSASRERCWEMERERAMPTNKEKP